MNAVFHNKQLSLFNFIRIEFIIHCFQAINRSISIKDYNVHVNKFKNNRIPTNFFLNFL